MAMVRKFLFDTDFPKDAPALAEMVEENAEEQEPPEPTFSEAELAAARDEGLAEGHRVGLAEGRGETERIAAEAIGRMAERLDEIAHLVRTHRETVTREAIAVASAMLRKIAPEIIEQGALKAIESAIAGCLPDLTEEPRLVVRVSETAMERVQARIDPVVKASGFAGDVVTIADPALEPADCVIEWADGGIRLDPSRVWRDIEAILAPHLAAAADAAGAAEQDSNATTLQQSAGNPDGPNGGVHHG